MDKSSSFGARLRHKNTRMKYILTIGMLIASVMIYGQKIPPRPSPPRLVNDYVNLLTPDQQAHLESRLVAYDDSTSVQIAVVIVPTLDDYAAVDYAVKLGRDWGIGNKKTNNGVILLVSTEPNNRQVFIAPGYGLEGALPDITCKQIVDAEIVPQLKQGNYYRAMINGTDAIIEASRGEYTAPAGYHDRGGSSGGGILFFIILMVVLLILFGGSGRGPRGGMMSRRGTGFIPFIFPTGGGGSGGWSGGGGSSGGFGGFGGGSFGGGGSGGSW